MSIVKLSLVKCLGDKTSRVLLSIFGFKIFSENFNHVKRFTNQPPRNLNFFQSFQQTAAKVQSLCDDDSLFAMNESKNSLKNIESVEFNKRKPSFWGFRLLSSLSSACSSSAKAKTELSDGCVSRGLIAAGPLLARVLLSWNLFQSKLDSV